MANRSIDHSREAALRRATMRSGVLSSILLFGVGLLVFAHSSVALAEPAVRARSDSRLFYCATPDTGPLSDPAVRRQVRFDAALNAAHGLAYFGAGAAIEFGTSPTRRWSSVNAFDDGIRNGLRGGSSSARDAAAVASDVTLALGIGALPLASLGTRFFETHDCLETFDMASEWIESLGLTFMLTEATKVATGRNRPFTEECDASPPSDADCDEDDRHLSFFSGHSSMAAAGAGLTCAFSMKRQVWGSSPSARYTPCALGITTALATGLLRMSADKHWGTDVLVSFAVGGLVGYFDTWGPLDLLRFTTYDSGGRVASTGIVLPFAREGQIGARLAMVF